MRNPTLHDVARAAGVSYSTADRVLNERGGVAEKSALRVRQAIEQLGYTRDIHAANLSRRRNYRFRFYIPQGDHGFFSILRRAAEAEAVARAPQRIRIEICNVPALDAAAMASELNRIEYGDCDCIAIVGIDSDVLAHAAARLSGLGITVVTLVSDMASKVRRQYVGIDNIVAGRTAGRLLRLAHGRASGRVLPVLGSLEMHDHRDRLSGARDVLSETGSPVAVLPPIEVQDRPALMDQYLRRALADDPDITGIYSIGAGNRALLALLRQLDHPRPVVVLHDLTLHTRAGLCEGLIDAVIDQKPVAEVALALDAMRAAADGLTPPPTDIIPAIFLKDNMPGDAGSGDLT